VRQVRQKSGLTQTDFAECTGTPVATLRDLEQGWLTPPGAALKLLQLIVKHPELSAKLVTA